jgi:hypothetical protein
MTHILRIDEMAKFGRHSAEQTPNLNKSIPEIYWNVVSDISDKIKAPLHLLTKEDLESKPLHFDVLNFFKKTGKLVGSDNGEYADGETTMVVTEELSKTPSGYDSLTVYALGVFGYDRIDDSIDWDYFESCKEDGRLANDVYNALEEVGTYAFYKCRVPIRLGNNWNPDELCDGNYIYVPMKIDIAGYDYAERIEERIEYDVTQTMLSAYKELRKTLNAYSTNRQ